MGKNGSIIYQTKQRFEELYQIGKSKHEAKMVERELCIRTGEKWNPARVPGIHSISTFKQYKKIAFRFAEYARKNGAKTLEQAYPLARAWLEREELKSDWSRRREAAALAKLFGCTSTDFGVQFGPRSRSEIHRSRVPRKHDQVSEYKNRDIIDFLRATGMRRKEIKMVRPCDIYMSDTGHMMVHVESGKGGRKREIYVLPQYYERVWEIRSQKPLNEPIFEKIENRIDVHSYRREYAQALYRYCVENMIDSNSTIYKSRDGREFSREALTIVSNALGHNRLEICVKHYL